MKSRTSTELIRATARITRPEASTPATNRSLGMATLDISIATENTSMADEESMSQINRNAQQDKSNLLSKCRSPDPDGGDFAMPKPSEHAAAFRCGEHMSSLRESHVRLPPGIHSASCASNVKDRVRYVWVYRANYARGLDGL